MNQTQLEHKLIKFTRNGKTPEAQDVLEKIGYGIAVLDACYEKLLTWRRRRKETKRLMGVQKEATATEGKARTVAGRLAQKFGKTGRVLFNDDKPVMTKLGLYPSIWSTSKTSVNGSEQTNGSSQGSSGPSMSTAAVIERWRLTFEAALDLEEVYLDRLAERGWGIAEITEALQAVEAYADADLDQNQKIRARRETQAEATALREELEKWYQEARSLTLLALEDLPPKKAARLKELLGL
jgi:hypothetical protein